MKIKFKIWIENEESELIIGEGLFKLLAAIQETGSISKASEQLNMSYRTAWGKLKKLEERLGYHLIEKKFGGKSGGGSTLTENGKQLLLNYQNLTHKTEAFVEQQFKQFLENCDLC